MNFSEFFAIFMRRNRFSRLYLRINLIKIIDNVKTK